MPRDIKMKQMGIWLVRYRFGRISKDRWGTKYEDRTALVITPRVIYVPGLHSQLTRGVNATFCVFFLYGLLPTRE